MSIKLIATDMDDTLLNSKIKVSEGNAAAIKKAIAAGVVVMIATGRMYVSVKPYADELGLDVPLVTYNGALVKGSKSGQVYYEKPMKLETAKKLLSYCREKGYYIQAYQGDSLYVHTANEFSKMYSAISGIPATAIGDDIYDIKEQPYKLLMMTKPEEFEQAWQEVAEKFKGLVDVTSSKDCFLELMEPGVNKWVAVKAIGEQYGIKPEEIMCIGDSNNDLPMIKNAGIGVAVANAKDAVRKAAKLVTASNDDDGVALAINTVLTEQAKEE